MEIFNTFLNQLDNEELSVGYFQQDGATSHTSHVSMAEIQSFFGDRVISKGLWPHRSPDLTSPDYFLCGYLKGRVHQNKPRTIDALKANMTEEIQAVTADVLARTFQNVACRVQSCLDANCGHFQHMLWCRYISHTTNVPLFKFRCDIFIGVTIIKEMPGSVASWTPCIMTHGSMNVQFIPTCLWRRWRKSHGLTILDVTELHRFSFCALTCVVSQCLSEGTEGKQFKHHTW